ncbi:MAG: phage tail protein [Nitriliruptorales bacterium]|nr:phage tail protein [Nitriliruptorales bacterium]
MGLMDMDTTLGWSFGFEFDGVVIKQIQELTGLKEETDVIDMKHNTNDGKYVNRKLPGRPKAGEITITRGLTDDKAFDDWMKKSQFGDMAGARKGGSVIIYDYTGAEVKRYKLANAWPKSLEIGTLKAGDTSVLTEKLVVTHEGCEPG